jgi:Uncharacterized protein involved in outer membrane biogenesis
MTKVGRITLISLGSLLLLVAVAIAVVCNIVFTPKKITPIVRNMLNDKLDCEVKLDTVELVFFSTFPHLALDIDNVALINPVEGAPSDVLVKVDNCKAKLNLMDLIKRKELVVNHVMLSNGEVNIYISPDSVANYDIYTSTSEDNDTSGFPLKLMQIEGVKLTNVALSYHDCTNNLHAVVDDLSSLNAALNWQKNAWLWQCKSKT